MKDKERLEYLKQHEINTDAGMKYADDSMEFYKQLIHIFLEEFTIKKRTAEAEAKKKSREYTILVHGLKNNAKALGADKLSEIAYEHEKASKREDFGYIEENLISLLSSWEETVNVFKVFVSEK